MAILGILTGIAVIGLGRMKGTAEQVALDQSLESLSSGTELKVVLVELGYPSAASVALSELRHNNSIVFEIQNVTPDSVIAKAHYSGRALPCRKLELSDSSDGKISNC